MMEINFMLWTKSILTKVGCYFLFMAIAQAEELAVKTPLYQQCPLYLQLDARSYVLEVEDVYAGSIEDGAILKPEPVFAGSNIKPSFWVYTTSLEYPFHIKCHYKDTKHYLVLSLQGALRCTFDNLGVRSKCE